MANSSDHLSGATNDLKTSFSLLAKAQAEDPAAWRRIVHLYSPLIDYWIRKRGITNHNDLENMRQEVFARIAKSLCGFSKDRAGTFRGWLRRVTNNLITNHRARRKEPPFVDNYVAGLLLDKLAVVMPNTRSFQEPNEDDDPHESVLISRQIMAWVRENHSKQQAEIFENLVVEDRMPSDVADSLKVPLGVVYQTKSRILARIRRFFGDLL